MVRERRKYEIEDVGVRYAKHESGRSCTINLPEGLSFYDAVARYERELIEAALRDQGLAVGSVRVKVLMPS